MIHKLEHTLNNKVASPDTSLMMSLFVVYGNIFDHDVNTIQNAGMQNGRKLRGFAASFYFSTWHDGTKLELIATPPWKMHRMNDVILTVCSTSCTASCTAR